MPHKTTHSENLMALKRVEGQIKGIQKMIDDKKYCIDIANQVYASIGGLRRVAEKILAKHMEHCVVDALSGKSEKEKQQKIDEIIGVIKRLNKL
ncbi:MAG: metal-sensitive transcriptional regulator [Candidatus Omnitrophica bacterium]|nr:metal-sensitive transcriptional regulator [Candidatus Omnitrophota bacterium]MBU2043640.1 metal-sensitive transcriptional regulator [Candidatus Omnitrophota bacterium]MBU2265799.1 metal-sensitive transcriptional regulator [Candidatus Omnitrophota bacterium]